MTYIIVFQKRLNENILLSHKENYNILENCIVTMSDKE